MRRRQTRGGDFGQSIAGFVFQLGIFRQRNPDRITQPVRQQCTNPNGGFHPTIFPFTGFGHPQMQWIIPSQSILLGRQETIGLYHDEWITRLHGKDKVVIIETATDIGKFQGRFDHTAGSIPIKGQDAGRQRAVIGPDPHTPIQFLTFLDQGFQGLDQVGPFTEIIFFRFVNLFLKIFASVGKVSWIDAYLFHRVRHHEGHDGLKVHIGTEWNGISLLKQTVPYFHTRIRLSLALYRNADQIKALIGTTHDLLDGRLDIGGIRGGHGLSDNGMVGTKIDGTASDGTRLTTLDRVQIFTIFVNGAVETLPIARSHRGSP